MLSKFQEVTQTIRHDPELDMGSSGSVEDRVDWTTKPVAQLEEAEAAFVWVVRHYYYFDRVTRLAKTDEIDKNIAKYVYCVW